MQYASHLEANGTCESKEAKLLQHIREDPFHQFSRMQNT